MVISAGSLVLKRRKDPLGDPEACKQKQISLVLSQRVLAAHFSRPSLDKTVEGRCGEGWDEVWFRLREEK